MLEAVRERQRLRIGGSKGHALGPWGLLREGYDGRIETLSRRVIARDAAQGLVRGSPFRAEIEQRDPNGLERALDAVTDALQPWDGKDAPMSAHVVTATR